jgi:hypothetical protein
MVVSTMVAPRKLAVHSKYLAAEAIPFFSYARHAQAFFWFSPCRRVGSNRERVNALLFKDL